MITPSNEGGVGLVAGLVKGGWENLASQVKKRSKDRNQHFAAGHGMSPEHLGILTEAALKLHQQKHEQSLEAATQAHAQKRETFGMVNEASGPGKNIRLTAEGDVEIQQAFPPETKSSKAGTLKNTPTKRGTSRGARRGGTY